MEYDHMEKGGWVYIMANRYRGGMYVGVTTNFLRRVQQHREGKGSTHVRDFNKNGLFIWSGMMKSCWLLLVKNWSKNGNVNGSLR